MYFNSILMRKIEQEKVLKIKLTQNGYYKFPEKYIPICITNLSLEWHKSGDIRRMIQHGFHSHR
jgi:hypothetical protein